jgi:fumarylacetoacetase
MTSTWVSGSESRGFGLHNLPYGVFSTGAGRRRRVGVAIGDAVLDASQLPIPDATDLAHSSLNRFMSRGPRRWAAQREALQELLSNDSYREQVEPHLIPRHSARMHLPIDIGDYVDFYSSRKHAENLGRIFRPGSDPLTPNWKHLPIGYHGRSGTVVVSGTPVIRPCGQRKSADDPMPSFGPSERLDLEAEIGFVIGVPSSLGTPVPVRDFTQHVFGAVVVNDWSARDLQAWEYAPLGPFLGKSFLTSISPWVVPLAALESARVPPPTRDVPLLPYLQDEDPWGLEITLEVTLNGELISRPPFRDTYWTPAQQLAHLTVNGASVRTGDLYASGTVSGPQRGQYGSLIELSWGGADPVALAGGQPRAFLADGDVVTIGAVAPGDAGELISFGEVTGQVQPARLP